MDPTELEPGTIALKRLLDAGCGLGFGVRLRIAVDVLSAVASDEGSAPLVPRAAGSRLVLERVYVDDSGQAHVDGDGNDSGAAELVWEILAGRELGEGQAAGLFDCTDDVTVPVSELVARALDSGKDFEQVGHLLEALEEAGRDYLDVHADVKQSIGPASSWAPSASTPPRSSPPIGDEPTYPDPLALRSPAAPLALEAQPEGPSELDAPAADNAPERPAAPATDDEPTLDTGGAEAEALRQVAESSGSPEVESEASVAVTTAEKSELVEVVAQSSARGDDEAQCLDDGWDLDLPSAQPASAVPSVEVPAKDSPSIEAVESPPPERPEEVKHADDVAVSDGSAAPIPPAPSSVGTSAAPAPPSTRAPEDLREDEDDEDELDQETEIMRFPMRKREGRRAAANKMRAPDTPARVAISGDEDADDAEPTSLLQRPPAVSTHADAAPPASGSAFEERGRERLRALRSRGQPSAPREPAPPAEVHAAPVESFPPAVGTGPDRSATKGRRVRGRDRQTESGEGPPPRVQRKPGSRRAVAETAPYTRGDATPGSSSRRLRIAVSAAAGAAAGLFLFLQHQSATPPQPHQAQPPSTVVAPASAEPASREPPMPRTSAASASTPHPGPSGDTSHPAVPPAQADGGLDGGTR